MCKMWKGLGDPKYLGAVRQTVNQHAEYSGCYFYVQNWSDDET